MQAVPIEPLPVVRVQSLHAVKGRIGADPSGGRIFSNIYLLYVSVLL